VKDLSVSLDIGTTKATVVVGKQNAHGTSLDIIGVGTAPFPREIIKKGVIGDVDGVIPVVRQAVAEAENTAGCKIHAVYAGIGGSHLRGFNSQGMVAIRDQNVTESDIERVMDAAKAVLIPSDQKVLHVLPQEFMVDHQDGMRDPMGVAGVRLEAKIHIIPGALSAVQNILSCIRQCDLEVEDLIAGQLASSYALLSEAEKQEGVCVIDIGGGTTDIAVFANGYIQHTAVIPVAGDQITNDIAVAFRTSVESAETLKIQHACAVREWVKENEMIEIPAIGKRLFKSFSRRALVGVIEPRLEELFSLVQAELDRQGLTTMLGAGIVITGGSVRMQGIAELAAELFQVPVRIGMPRNISGLVDVLQNPIYSTGVGLLQYGEQAKAQRRSERNAGQGFKGVVGRLKHWFQGNF
jgi:cell division protein FtsA